MKSKSTINVLIDISLCLFLLIEAIDCDGNRIEAIRVFGIKGTEKDPLVNIYDGDQWSYCVCSRRYKYKPCLGCR